MDPHLESQAATSIHDVQYTDDAGDSCYPAGGAGDTVRIRGYVSAVDSHGYYLQEAAAPWSGIYVYDPRLEVLARLVIGDLLDVVGVTTEFYGLTEVYNIQGWSFVPTGDGGPDDDYNADNVALTPLEVTTGAIGTACNPSGEMYEGLLVVLRNVRLLSEPSQYGMIQVDDGSSATMLDDEILNTDAYLLEVWVWRVVCGCGCE